MKILFDQGTPAPLRHFLIGHVVTTGFEMGWSNLVNGELLAAAEGTFDVLITTDKNLRYQQNLSGRQLGVIVLPTTSWPRVRRPVAVVVEAVSRIRPSGFMEIEFPADP